MTKIYELDSSREDYLKYLAVEYNVSLDILDELCEEIGDIDQYGGVIEASKVLVDDLEDYCKGRYDEETHRLVSQGLLKEIK
tara:strand:+ start:915 stop:1160 length:246 start_codon:yes stop_codon:yes gene_type:complete